jgi:hypothetical protein
VGLEVNAPAGYPMVDDRAPCRHGNPDRWFTDGDQARAVADECTPCPFRQPCLMWALYHEREGCWGGTTPRERQELRRRAGILMEPAPQLVLAVGKRAATRPRPACGTVQGYYGHRRRLEPTCEDCRVAWNVHNRGQRRKQTAS